MRIRKYLGDTDIEFLLMVVLLLAILVFDKSIEPEYVDYISEIQEEQVIEVVDAEEEMEIIETENFVNDKQINYIYEVGDTLYMVIDGIEYHLIVVETEGEEAFLRELGKREGKEVTLNNILK